ncbi:Spc34p SCDLUD_003642 [Saccharomycodes ludwigii]|uniref:Spc34p n=1 Tax=Saccharomycodes ludwigii TaxID=36035 RepID=UPI001E84E3FE|nr:hypothetical protein SCDLUD_003642 [Saccharomycodes ludwigii]KAH3900646.1 hypothetical protein SCDLUD_003642 [Saccharomycodes ludwigii]
MNSYNSVIPNNPSAMNLDNILNKISNHCDSISTLYFKPPGIYSNAVLNNQDDNTPDNNNDKITKLIRDADPEEEASLYDSKNNEFPIRKDGSKIGIADYLNSKSRTRPLNESPVIEVPKDYYLKQNVISNNSDERLENTQEEDYNNINGRKLDRRRTTLNSNRRTSTLDDIFNNNNNNNNNNNSASTMGVDSNVFNILLRKYNDNNEIKDLLYALRDGSVITNYGDNEDAGSKRRKTLFVEDFSNDLIFQIFNDIIMQWPLNEYTVKYNDLYHKFQELSTQVIELKDEIQTQEDKIGYYDDINDLITKEQGEVDRLKKIIEQRKKIKSTDKK